MPSCNTLEALRRSKRESRRERRERSSHNGQRHERMGATVRHHYYQQMESKEWWNSTAYCNMAAALDLRCFLPRPSLKSAALLPEKCEKKCEMVYVGLSTNST